MTSPNVDTVRSLADLLVEDEAGDEENSGFAGKTELEAHNIIKKLSRISSGSSIRSNGSKSIPLEEMNDSVFGDIPLEDTSYSTPLPYEIQPKEAGTLMSLPPFESGDSSNHLETPQVKPDLDRHPSLRSQLSNTSTDKVPVKRELGVKIFVSSLFILIVTIVAATLHFAHLQQYMVKLGQRILVYEDTRWIHLEDNDRSDALIGQFGMGIPDGILPHDCSNEKSRRTHLCLKWKKRAILDIDFWQEDSSKCYTIGWKTLNPNIELKDCYKLDYGKIHWFGGALKANQRWPLMNMSIPLMPYITGDIDDDNAFGPVIERYWLSSKGVALFSSDLSSPLHISWNDVDSSDDNSTVNDDNICLVVGGEGRNPHKKNLYLNYTVCHSESIRDVHRLALEKISNGRNTSEIVHPDVSLFRKPSISIDRALNGNANQTSITDLAQTLGNKSIDIGMFLIENGWQLHSGDFRFDENKFPNVSSMLDFLGYLSHPVALGISPYISIHSRNFVTCDNNEFLVKDGGGETAGFFRLKNDGQVGNKDATNLHCALDITYPLPKQWLLSGIQEITDNYGIKLLSFQGGMTTLLPYTTDFTSNSSDPNLYTFNYANLALEGKDLTILDSATNIQGQPVVIRLKVTDLQNALPLVLTLGIMGYPYIMPVMHLADIGSKPSKDLYIRSVQLSAFLPVMHLTHPPYIYDEQTIRIVKAVIKLHQDIVHSRVVNHTTHSLLLDPVVKPLWWIDPHDEIALNRDSEFILGHDLLVAPILKENSVSRDIYLPKGEWLDPRDKQIYSGPLLLESYTVNIDQVAYFFKHMSQ